MLQITLYCNGNVVNQLLFIYSYMFLHRVCKNVILFCFVVRKSLMSIGCSWVLDVLRSCAKIPMFLWRRKQLMLPFQNYFAQIQLDCMKSFEVAITIKMLLYLLLSSNTRHKSFCKCNRHGHVMWSRLRNIFSWMSERRLDHITNSRRVPKRNDKVWQASNIEHFQVHYGNLVQWLALRNWL